MRAFGLLALFLVGFLAVMQPNHAFASGGGEAKVEDTGPKYFKVGPLAVPILKNGKIDQYLVLVVSLEVASAEALAEVEKRKPAITDAYLTALYGTLYAGKGLRGGLVDVDVVRNKLDAANKKVLPDGTVTNIFLEQVQQRPG
jgi:hypothetical protein